MDEDQAMIDNQAPISQQLDADGQALLEAAEQGDAATVRPLLAAGLDPNTARQPGTSYSALHLAAAGGHVSTIMTLLVFGATLDDSSAAEAATPLWLAVHGQHLAAGQVLLGAGASGIAERLHANAGDGSLLTTLAGAGVIVTQSATAHSLEAGDFNTLKLLLELGVAPGDECGRALVTAAAEGQLAEVKALLEAGVPADCAVYDPVLGEEEQVEDEPRTALMAAAQGGHTDIMRCLLAAGADVEARWWTFCYEEYLENGVPVHVTALEVCGTAEAARVLLEAGAAVQDPARDYFPLITHILLKREDVVPVLLEAGADPNAARYTGQSMLHLATHLDLAKAVASLLAAGADVNASRDSDGATPLLCAVGFGHGGLVEALLGAGASAHAADKHGNTVLHVFATGQVNCRDGGRILKLLSAAGADLNAVNDCGESPLALAVYYMDREVVAALIAAGAAPSTEVLAQALRRPGLRGSWMTVLLPSRRISISTTQLREWAGAAFSDRRDTKQAMFWGVWALRRRLPAELLHLIAALRCMLE